MAGPASAASSPSTRLHRLGGSQAASWPRARLEALSSLLLPAVGLRMVPYRVKKGAPGHVLHEVVDTWWYQDDQGAGEQAYRRAILAQRFEWVVFDYTVTAQLEEELLRLMEGRYDRHASFPARVHGQYGTIDVFRAAR